MAESEGGKSKSVCVVDADDDDNGMPVTKKIKVQEKLNACEAKAKRVGELAIGLKEMHKEKEL